VKDQGFSYFLLLFYSQVIGLNAPLVGAALTIALVIDAISDPLVGYWSDNFRSKWGRRHLFMYASAIPVTLCYYLLWSPPAGWSNQALFIYLVVLAILTRTAITFFETPSAALAPELTLDYDQRTSLQSYRTFFGWTGGNAMTVMMFFFLFPAFTAPGGPEGQFSRAAYGVYGAIAAALIFGSIMLSAIGTHGRIRHLAQPPIRPRPKLGTVFREIFETFANRSFLSLFATSIFAFTAAGLTSALSVYFSTYFWGFTSIQIGLLTLIIFLSVFVGAAVAPPLTRSLGKKTAAIALCVATLLVSPLAILLRLTGVLEMGTDATFWAVVAIGQVNVILTIALLTLVLSMMSDVVEQSELKTGRRSEGLLFSANTFIQKMVTGLGVMVATVVLTLAKFPVGVAPADVPQDVLMRLGWYYIPADLLLRAAMIAVLLTYSLTRQTHADNLRKLADAAKPS
jgi:glycoside/pentoside/hexuronide:cation symporter, GPH family